jgi:mannose-6-phosphate isomerase-like protein (cupin superfamily)
VETLAQEAPAAKDFARGDLLLRMVEYVRNGEVTLAIIIAADFSDPGVHFFTSGEMTQQLAYMRHGAGKIIAPHIHKRYPREVQSTQEVLLIKRGRLRVDFYDDQQGYLESRMLRSGDVILLISGGHGFEVLEEIEMIEVKQGPYVGEQDKQRFVGITADAAKLTK